MQGSLAVNYALVATATGARRLQVSAVSSTRTDVVNSTAISVWITNREMLIFTVSVID
jgi:hypothetical protein